MDSIVKGVIINYNDLFGFMRLTVMRLLLRMDFSLAFHLK